MATLALKKQELLRRVASVPAELLAWKKATTDELDKNAHFSQVQAIGILVDALTTSQPAAVEALDPAGDALAFEVAALDIMRSIIKAQKVWDFFRDKLELRHSPVHKDPLWVADTVAWDCHRPVMDLAVERGIVDGVKVREPPLIYCSAEFSPATWTRGKRPNDGRSYALGEALLPIPVIELPWDHLVNSWDYLSLHHEVGHDIEADLALRPVLNESVKNQLANAGVPTKRGDTWVKWVGEVFADLCALRLAGPAFTETLMQLLLLPKPNVLSYDPEDPHPTPYIRILLNTHYIRKLGASQSIQEHASRIEQDWRTIYGATSGNADLDAFVQDFGTVCNAMMDTPFPALKDHSVAQLVPFTETHDARIRQAVRYFGTGMAKPQNLDVRHVPSAARLAINEKADAGVLTFDEASKVHKRVLEYVREKAPSGLRGGGPEAHRAFIASFAGRLPI